MDLGSAGESTAEEIVHLLLKKRVFLHGLVPACSGCGHFILSRSVLRVNHQVWHEQCLQCNCCGCPLTHGKCYSRDGRFYCREDFLRISKAHCDSCRLPVHPDALVYKARGFVYHAQCFFCSMCSTRLTKSDQYYLMHSGELLCKADYGTAIQTEGENCALKRPRTSITSQQLRVLKQAYKTDPKPTRSVRERLAKETGLLMRVVQVWFQNRRAKDRRKHGTFPRSPTEQVISGAINT